MVTLGQVVAACAAWFVAALYLVEPLYQWQMRSAARRWQGRYDTAEGARRRSRSERWRWILGGIWICIASFWTFMLVT